MSTLHIKIQSDSIATILDQSFRDVVIVGFFSADYD